MKSLSSIIILTFFSAGAFAQTGVLDSTLGGDGKVTTDFGNIHDEGNAIAIQDNGKIVVGGYSNVNYFDDFSIARYNIDGNLDSNFGLTGKVTTDFESSTDRAYSIAIQPDQKILLGGYSFFENYYDFALVRYNLDGLLDSNFGTGGKVTTSLGNPPYAIGRSTILQSDNKILLGGYVASTNSDFDFALVRYNPNGTLDSSFGIYGKVITVVSTTTDEGLSLALQPDGKILFAGISGDLPNSAFAIVRYNQDGSIDSSFGNDGKEIVSLDNSVQNYCYAVLLQPDGKIILTGSTRNLGNDDFGLVRFNANGVLDSSFGINGMKTIDLGTIEDISSSAVCDQQGKILIGGWIDSTADNDDLALLRCNANGTVDSTFGVGGRVTTDFAGHDDYSRAIAIQFDGKILLAGSSFNGLHDDFALARYLSDLNVGIVNFSSTQSSPLIYPNPIQQTETLEYTLTQIESLTIILYDVNGRLIKTFVSNEQRTGGAHKETLNIGVLPSGNYFLTLSNGSQKMTVKMVKQ